MAKNVKVEVQDSNLQRKYMRKRQLKYKLAEKMAGISGWLDSGIGHKSLKV